MIIAGSSSSLVGLIVIMSVVVWAASLWMFVLTVRFLSSGRRAFERYLRVTDVRVPAPHPPMAPSGPTSEPPGWKH